MSHPETTDHSTCGAALDAAVAWLRETPKSQRPGPAIPELRRRFGLSPAEACRALAEHHLGMARAT
ncbi:MAG: hypothetical protein E5X50_19705 [Mesorhizobium sp.]|nr:MAG: hypothetical protein E5X50_19705 [Mesorhizobium sp.]